MKPTPTQKILSFLVLIAIIAVMLTGFVIFLHIFVFVLIFGLIVAVIKYLKNHVFSKHKKAAQPKKSGRIIEHDQ